MDITDDFQNIVKKICSEKHVLDPLPLTKKKDVGKNIPVFRKKALAVLTTVSELETTLNENSKLYSGSGFLPVSSTGSAFEREQFDLQFQKAVKLCTELVESLKKPHSSVSGSVLEARKSTVNFIENRIKQLNRKYNEQRSQSLRRRSELEKLSKFSLGSDVKQVNKPLKLQLEIDSGGIRNRRNVEFEPTRPKTMDYIEEVNPSHEEDHGLEQENQQLYNEFTSILEDVHSVETKVVKIAELQQFFAENILVQDAEIQRISDTVVGSSENVKEGNEQIRNAMQNNAGSRIIILFALIVLALSVLFLDWYND